jgi:hypothetical protein
MPEAAKPPTDEPDEPDESENAKTEEGEAEQPVFANRAERRAKGKGKASPHAQSQGKGGHYPGGRGSVQSPRQYGNRRTG